MGTLTAFGLGPLPEPAAPPAAVRPSGLTPALGDFTHSAAFGMLIVAAITLYLYQRVL